MKREYTVLTDVYVQDLAIKLTELGTQEWHVVKLHPQDDLGTAWTAVLERNVPTMTQIMENLQASFEEFMAKHPVNPPSDG